MTLFFKMNVKSTYVSNSSFLKRFYSISLISETQKDKVKQAARLRVLLFLHPNFRVKEQRTGDFRKKNLNFNSATTKVFFFFLTSFKNVSDPMHGFLVFFFFQSIFLSLPNLIFCLNRKVDIRLFLL